MLKEKGWDKWKPFFCSNIQPKVLFFFLVFCLNDDSEDANDGSDVGQ